MCFVSLLFTINLGLKRSYCGGTLAVSRRGEESFKFGLGVVAVSEGRRAALNSTVRARDHLFCNMHSLSGICRVQHIQYIVKYRGLVPPVSKVS